MSYLFLSILSSIVISLLSLIGISLFFLKEERIKKLLILFISFSAGAFLGGAFFHLLPESLELFTDSHHVFYIAVLSFIAFFLLERVLRWHHCHETGCDTHKHLGYMNLVGDGFHNLIDGIIIVSSFAVDVKLGLLVTLSIALHEIPQEIGDFGVLIYSGFSKRKALIYNLFVALTSVIGVLIGYFLIDKIENIQGFLLAFASGGFLYIAASDLIPELHKESSTKKSLLSFLFFLISLTIMFIL